MIVLIVLLVNSSHGGFGETGGVDYPTARGLYVEDPIKTDG